MTEGNSEKEGIYTFDYTIKDAELTLTWPTWSTFSHTNARYSCLRGRVLSGTGDHITGASEQPLKMS